jgi:primary-amine oxidase
MRFIALPLIVFLIGLLAYGLNQSAENRLAAVETVSASPWDGLSAQDYTMAAQAVRTKFDGKLMIIRMSLQQPDKATALAWRPGTQAQRAAEVTFLLDDKPFVSVVDLTDGTPSQATPISGGQPMLSGVGELTPIVMQAASDPEVLAALAKRGVDEGEAVCLPRTIGRFFRDRVDVVNERVVRLDCVNIAPTGGFGILPSTNLFSRPIEGLSILYSVTRGKVVEIVDSYSDGPASSVPPHNVSADEFHEGAMKHRAALRPIDIKRPQGLNFTINGSQISWQGWSFRLRFDPRQGTVLNRVGHQSDKGFRSVAYEIAMSEMFVPYYDNDPNWFYRAYFDMGEYGFGNLATPLLGSDCPAGAVFQSAILHMPDGSPFEAKNRMCIFEHDPGHPAWRHYESTYEGIPGLAKHHSRRATELVVRMVATIGNYDYFQDYVFGQDGRLRIRLISTGVDAVKGVVSETLASPTAKADTATGTLIAPHRVAVNHDHFFSYRIDLDVDGQENNFDRLMLRAIEQPKSAPRRGVWGVVPQRIKTEKQASTRMKADKPALLVFSNAQKQNAMGYPSSYQLMMPNVKPLVSQFDETYKRAYFVQNNLWVSRFKRNEIFAAGGPVNQSIPYLGLPEFVADNENLENSDVVAWATIGFHHVPMAEDWPVMPSKVDEIVLKPRNFFDRNPAIDLRP